MILFDKRVRHFKEQGTEQASYFKLWSSSESICIQQGKSDREQISFKKKNVQALVDPN